LAGLDLRNPGLGAFAAHWTERLQRPELLIGFDAGDLIFGLAKDLRDRAGDAAELNDSSAGWGGTETSFT